MKSLAESIQKPKEKLLKTFVCENCNRTVEQKEMIIPIGPRKGEKIIANMGCKCEDMKIAEEHIKARKNAKLSKLNRMFKDNSLVNKSLKNASFRSYNPATWELGEVKSRLMQYAREFDVETSNNVLLVGGYGVGKSHLSIAVTKELIEKGHTCLFLSVPKLLTKIKQTYGGNSDFSEADILNIIESVDLFILDDLGTEYTNRRSDDDNWTHTKLFEVLDSRSGKPTIYTTNLTGEQLRNKVNSRNLSRIMDGTEVIEMAGPDYRMRGLKGNEATN